MFLELPRNFLGVPPGQIMSNVTVFFVLFQIAPLKHDSFMRLSKIPSRAAAMNHDGSSNHDAASNHDGSGTAGNIATPWYVVLVDQAASRR